MSADLKSRIGSGEQLIGTFISVAAPALIEAAAYAGFDYVVLDGEHGPFGVSSYEPMTRAAAGAGIPILIRVPANDPRFIHAALDAGAAGVQVPQVNTRSDVERAVSAAHYFPLGRRGLAAGRAAHWGIDQTVPEAVERALATTVLIPQLEDASALNDLQSLLSSDEVDLFFVGPTDLSQSLGVPGKTDAPIVLDCIARIEEAARLVKVRLGTSVRSGQAAQAAFGAGYQVVTVVAMLLFGRAAQSFLAEARANA